MNKRQSDKISKLLKELLKITERPIHFERSQWLWNHTKEEEITYKLWFGDKGTIPSCQFTFLTIEETIEFLERLINEPEFRNLKLG